jgi:hypothetical protein
MRAEGARFNTGKNGACSRESQADILILAKVEYVVVRNSDGIQMPINDMLSELFKVKVKVQVPFSWNRVYMQVNPLHAVPSLYTTAWW